MTLPGLERSVSGFETLTVGSTAVGPTAASTINATAAHFGPLETQQVRWRADGAAPTASVGALLEVGQTLSLEGDAARKVQFIKTGGSDAALPVHYFA